MNKVLETIKSNLTIITLIFYFLGYAYLGVYYFQFDISIVHYINLQDIIFSAISSLVNLVLIYFFVEFILYLIGKFILTSFFHLSIKRKFLNRLGNSSRVQKYLEFRSRKYKSDNIKSITFFLLILIAFLFLCITDEWLLVFSFFFPFIIVKSYPISFNKQYEMRVGLNLFYSGILTFVFILSFLCWGYMDGNYAKKK